MMDALLLLTPLLVLAIVLLSRMSAAVSRPREAAPPEPPFNTHATLHILDGPNIGQDVKTLKVVFKADVIGIDGAVTRKTEHILQNNDIQPDTFLNDFEVVSLYESGTVNCRCAFFMDWGLIYADEADHDKVADEATAGIHTLAR